MEKTTYVVCVNNEGYEASIETRKIYRALPDQQAGELKMVRVIDESGEDYLYPADFFIEIKLPKPVIERLSLTA